MVVLHPADPFAYSTWAADKDVRRQLDRSVGRALVDPEFATALLRDPTVALEGLGCPPPVFKLLRGIRAADLVDFARQARALFWMDQPATAPIEEEFPLAAGAGH